MFTKTILATATAALIAVGSLGATTTSASAGYIGFGGVAYGSGYAYGGYNNHGWFFGYKPLPPKPVVQKVCSPTYKTVKVWRPYYGWVWQTVNAGPSCHFVSTYPSYPRPW